MDARFFLGLNMDASFEKGKREVIFTYLGLSKKKV
jgi:hypothetical protein